MMRSMFSGVSGLRAHQLMMDVISNNIANVNTVAYKSSRITFKEMYNQLLKPASAPSQNNTTIGRAGTNPQQIGLGVSTGSIDVIHDNTSVQRTDVSTDLAIEGEGFFIVSDGTSMMYTRAGNFRKDLLGNLTTPNGYYVLGWMGQDGIVDTSGPLEAINMTNIRMNGKATDEIVFEGNLNSDLANGDEIDYDVLIYDSLGGQHKVTFTFKKEDTSNNIWSWTVSSNDPSITISTPTQTFNQTWDPDDTIAGDEININISDVHGYFVFDGSDGHIAESVTHDASGNIVSTQLIKGEVPNITITMNSTQTGAEDIVIDTQNIVFSPNKFTQTLSETTVKVSEMGGYPPGDLENVEIDSMGRLIGMFTNGMQQHFATIALAKFSNPSGLSKIGENMFQVSTNSGNAIIGEPGVDGRGVLNTKALEMSNVDLSREFTDMIIAQRGFQANSRIITASDEMLQELVNLKR